MVKTRAFANPRYIGDPINAVRIFNEKEVDEIALLDIEATRRGSIRFDYIEEMAGEAFMPVTYGGGVSNVADVGRLLRLGVEKVVINSACAKNPELIRQISEKYGASTVIAAIDFKRNIWGKWKPFSHNGQNPIGFEVIELCRHYEKLGAGELLLNCISQDGTMTGYPVDILKEMSDAVRIPVIACGGAGSLQHMADLARQTHIKAFAAGSMFVYYGPHRAVLINYPDQATLKETFALA
jgi:cyclase